MATGNSRQDIEQQVAYLARRLAWFQACRRLLRIISVATLVLLVFGMLDWWWRPEAGVLRWSQSLLAVTLILTAGMRSGWLGRRWQPSQLQTAWLIERSEPRLRGRLAAILSQTSLGSEQSAALYSAAVEQVARLLDDWRSRYGWRWRVLGPTAALSLLAGAALCCFSMLAPISSQTALLRLTIPWSDLRWPQRDQLSFEPLPDLVPRGEPIVLKLINRNRPLPSTLRLQWRVDDDEQVFEREIETEAESIRLTFPGVDDQLQVRVIGGDGDTQWQIIPAAPRPQLQTLQLVARPPACYQQPPVLGERSLRAPAGSRLTLRGTADQPLQHVDWVGESDTELKPLPPIEVDAEGYTFQLSEAEWQLQANQSPRLRLVARSGLDWTTPPLTLVADLNEPPRLEWGHRELERNGRWLIPQGAVIPLSVTYVDHQAWSQVRLSRVRDDGAVLEVLESWDVPSLPPSETASQSRGSDDTGTNERTFAFEFQWRPIGNAPWPSELGVVRWEARDSCGEMGLLSSPDCQMVSVPEYDRALTEALQSWLEQVREGASELQGLLDSLDASASTSAESRLRAWQDAWFRLQQRSLLDNPSLAAELQQLRHWQTRLPDSTTASRAIDQATQQWINVLPPQVQAVQQALTASLAATDRPWNERVSPLQASVEQLLETLSSWLGNQPQNNVLELRERLTQVLTRQIGLRETIREAVGAGAPAADQVDRWVGQQDQLANTLERMQLMAAETLETPTTWLTDTSRALLGGLQQQGVSAWQREASRFIQQRQWASANDAQRQAESLLSELIASSNLASEDGRPASGWQVSLKRLGSQLQRLAVQQEFRELAGLAWPDPTWQTHLEAEMRRVEAEGQAIATHLKEREVDRATQVLDALSELAQLRANFAGQPSSTVTEGLQRAGNSLFAAADSTPEESRSGFARWLSEAQIWFDWQTSLSEDLQALERLNVAASQPARRQWSQRQTQLEQRIASQRELLDAEAAPILVPWLETLSQRMNALASDVDTDRLSGTWLARSQELATELEDLVASGQASPPTEPASDPSAETGGADESTGSELWPWQVAVLRRDQQALARSTQLADANLTDLERRTTRARQLARQQERLADQVKQLQLALIPAQSAPSENPPRLPGLPGIPGTDPPATSSPNVSPPASEPTSPQVALLEEVQQEMHVVAGQLESGDLGPSTQSLQDAIIQRLTLAPGSSRPQTRPAEGTQAGAQAGGEASETARVVEMSGLVPAAVLEQSGVWGHLPERIESRVRAGWVEQWVPGYEAISIDYFRRLGQTLQEQTP